MWEKEYVGGSNVSRAEIQNNHSVQCSTVLISTCRRNVDLGYTSISSRKTARNCIEMESKQISCQTARDACEFLEHCFEIVS